MNTPFSLEISQNSSSEHCLAALLAMKTANRILTAVDGKEVNVRDYIEVCDVALKVFERNGDCRVAMALEHAFTGLELTVLKALVDQPFVFDVSRMVGESFEIKKAEMYELMPSLSCTGKSLVFSNDQMDFCTELARLFDKNPAITRFDILEAPNVQSDVEAALVVSFAGQIDLETQEKIEETVFDLRRTYSNVIDTFECSNIQRSDLSGQGAKEKALSVYSGLCASQLAQFF